ncbi:hypothetical protein PPL_04065 [Heterostelium album PN500]|uniref:Uncharacterized protein n=1 Tax=Heterostelium pallidum (strain ATCC 26659 / Pp 5 / PN500) TaxID=670386 RepID=D3B5X7_HETP5|nr:hypothetical protein PPL_04065 [Heterostelium album PN500]EFA83275.1 hypothetical protein PPL_04065 [Heterostelium album PN500]|eukprot:XP_020435392.1 hypothetical protein PPL_04065 [Heterostelium album PN500]
MIEYKRFVMAMVTIAKFLFVSCRLFIKLNMFIAWQCFCYANQAGICFQLQGQAEVDSHFIQCQLCTIKDSQKKTTLPIKYNNNRTDQLKVISILICFHSVPIFILTLPILAHHWQPSKFCFWITKSSHSLPQPHSEPKMVFD